METRKLQLSGTQTQDSIRADITFHLILLGSSVCSVGSFLDKGEQLGQTDRPAASHLYNSAPHWKWAFPHLWSTCRYLHVSHMLMFPRLRRKAAASCTDRELKAPGVSFLSTRNTLPRRLSMPHSEVVCRWGLQAPCLSELTSWDS